jgi:ATP-binding cassette subfamily B (MDR/TAP) protein 1
MKTIALCVCVGAFAGMGALLAFAMTIQGYGFAVVSERLTQRLRLLGYQSMLHQDIGWFDADEHASGALTTTLARFNFFSISIYTDRFCVSHVSISIYMTMIE